MDNSLRIEKMKESAIEKALEGHFDEAIEINKQILELHATDTDTMMQLAHAYWQNSDLTLAKKQYQKVLDIEPNNSLAKKKLTLLKTLGNSKDTLERRKKGATVPITDLIEEPGKTKTLKLSNIGKPEHISLLTIGEEVVLKIRKRKIEVRDFSGNFIGYVPDDVSKRLIELVNNECEYQAYIFSIDKNEVKVFLREMKKSAKFRNISSFVSEETQALQLTEQPEHTKSSEDEFEDDEIAVDSEELILKTPDEIRAAKEAKEEEEETNDQENEYHEYEE